MGYYIINYCLARSFKSIVRLDIIIIKIYKLIKAYAGIVKSYIFLTNFYESIYIYVNTWFMHIYIYVDFYLVIQLWFISVVLLKESNRCMFSLN